MACEMDNYAALQTDVRIRPGTTFIISPYVDFECLRDGLGVRVFYVLTNIGLISGAYVRRIRNNVTNL
jgi:hypothetical protein